LPRGVVLGVRGEHHHQIELEPDRVALDLDVAFLKDVEQSDLDLAGEIGQLVDREDPAVGPRQQPVVHRQFIGEVEPGLRRLDRIDVADHVGDRDVGGRELLDVALVATQPADRQRVAFLRDARAARPAQRRERVVVNFAAWHHRDRVVEQFGEAAQDAALGLAAQAEQDEVVARQHRVHQLRDHRLVVADDAGKERLAGLQLADEVVADFLLDRFRAIARLPEFSKGRNGRHGSILSHVAK